jgi:LPXTG-motif cell wall-anchored protein
VSVTPRALLAATGFDVVSVSGSALALIGVGGTAALVARRRREASSLS